MVKEEAVSSGRKRKKAVDRPCIHKNFCRYNFYFIISEKTQTLHRPNSGQLGVWVKTRTYCSSRQDTVTRRCVCWRYWSWRSIFLVWPVVGHYGCVTWHGQHQICRKPLQIPHKGWQDCLRPYKNVPRREAEDVWCQLPMWNLRAVIWFPLPISFLSFLPSPLAVSRLSFFC